MSKSTKEQPDMRVLKTASCKTLSGKSTLTYQLGCNPDNAVHIRISKNSSAGQFSPEWIKVDDILKAFAKVREGAALTSFLLEPLLRGRSVNTPAFIVAALCSERLIRVLKGKKRGHEFLDPEGFTARMDKLVASQAKPKGTTTTRKKAVTRKAASKKAAIKTRSVARKKTAKTT